MQHRIVNDCLRAIAQHFELGDEGFDKAVEEGLTPRDLWTKHSKEDVPTVVGAITDFFAGTADISPLEEFIVFGLTITETNPEGEILEFWKRLFSPEKTDDVVSTKAQLTHMGIAIDAFLNETQSFGYIMDNYFGINYSDETPETNDNEETTNG